MIRLRHHLHHRLHHHHRLLSTTNKATASLAVPRGIPYDKLTVGVPKETFALEKRVAATPDVSYFFKVCLSFLYKKGSGLLTHYTVDGFFLHC